MDPGVELNWPGLILSRDPLTQTKLKPKDKGRHDEAEGGPERTLS